MYSFDCRALLQHSFSLEPWMIQVVVLADMVARSRTRTLMMCGESSPRSRKRDAAGRGGLTTACHAANCAASDATGCQVPLRAVHELPSRRPRLLVVSAVGGNAVCAVSHPGGKNSESPSDSSADTKPTDTRAANARSGSLPCPSSESHCTACRYTISVSPRHILCVYFSEPDCFESCPTQQQWQRQLPI